MLADRSILVTGGSSGIGRELVRQYAANGARVLTVARREAELLETIDGLDRERVFVVPADNGSKKGRQVIALEAMRVAPIDDDGALIQDAFESLLNERTRLVAISHTSNAIVPGFR